MIQIESESLREWLHKWTLAGVCSAPKRCPRPVWSSWMLSLFFLKTERRHLKRLGQGSPRAWGVGDNGIEVLETDGLGWLAFFFGSASCEPGISEAVPSYPGGVQPVGPFFFQPAPGWATDPPLSHPGLRSNAGLDRKSFSAEEFCTRGSAMAESGHF